MEYMIYTFGGQAELINNIFNGIARVFASNSAYFTPVGKIALTLGAMWAGTRAMFNANIGIFGKQWFLPTFLAFTLLFTPKATVWIKDDLANTVHKIDNIPFAIAFFSSLPSTISYSLAEIIEKELNIADSVRSSRTGLMFGAKLVAKFREIKIQDPILLDNAKQFCKQCYMKPWVMGNILGKKKDAEETPNMLTFINNNIPHNFGIYYKNPADGVISFKDCQEVAPLLTAQMRGEANSPHLLTSLGSALGIKNDRPEQLAQRIRAISTDTLAILQRSTTDAHEWVKQSMMLNAYRESLDDWREGSGHQRLWPELISMNASRGLYQQSFGWLIAGEMASQTLPLMQTVMFLLVVTSVFIVFPFAMFPGGMEVLKLWIRLLIWVNTWPVFFAIINALGMHVLSLRSGIWGPDFGMDKLSQGQFSDFVLHTYAIIQLFASSVPILSWMIISKSGYALVNLTEKLLTTSVGGALGASAVDNTISLDNVNIGNRQLAQQHVGPSLSMGALYDDGAIRATQGIGGGTAIEERASQLATNYRGSDMEMNALQKGYNDSVSYLSSLNQRKASLDSVEAAQMQDYAIRWLRSHDVTDAASERIAHDMRTVAGNGYGAQESFSDRTGKGTETHSALDLDGHLGVNTNFEPKTPFRTPFTKLVIKGNLGIGGKVATGVGARNSQDVSQDKSVQHTESYQESLDRVRGYTKNHDDRDNYGTSDTLSNSMQATWREQQQIAKEQAQTTQSMQQYQEQQNYISQHQASVDANWNDEVLDAVQSRHELTNKQEALTYLNDHYGEGWQVLAGLVAAKHGDLMHNDIQAKALNLQDKVRQDIPSEKLDYDINKQQIKEQYNNQHLPEHIKKQVDQHLGPTQRQNIERMVQSENLQKQSENLKNKFNDGQQHFNETSNSTIYRTGKEGATNMIAPIISAADTGKSLLNSAKNILITTEEEKNE